MRIYKKIVVIGFFSLVGMNFVAAMDQEVRPFREYANIIYQSTDPEGDLRHGMLMGEINHFTHVVFGLQNTPTSGFIIAAVSENNQNHHVRYMKYNRRILVPLGSIGGNIEPGYYKLTWDRYKAAWLAEFVTANSVSIETTSED